MNNLFNLADKIAELDDSEAYWTSFFEKRDLEIGVMKLDPQTEDTQSPHKSDEVYFVVEGDGKINIDGKDFEVRPPQAIFVPKETRHHFHSHTIPIIAYYVLN